MPKRLALTGKRASLVRYNLSLPLALKKEAAKAAAADGRDLADWIRDAMREKLAGKPR